MRAVTYGLLLALGLAGCNDEIKETYTLDILAAEDVLALATKVTLEINNQPVATSDFRRGGSIDLSLADLDPGTTTSAVFAIRGVDATGKVVAFGQTPEVEVLKGTVTINVLVQKPGSVAAVGQTAAPFKDHVAAATETRPIDSALRLAMTVGVFGTGRTKVLGSDGMTRDDFSPWLRVYNPLAHSIDDVGLLESRALTAQQRADASLVAHMGNQLVMFGGLARPNPVTPEHPTAQVDVFRIERLPLSNFRLRPLALYDPVTAGVARTSTTLVSAGGGLFAFGGLAEDMMGQLQPLDTIVSISTTTPPDLLALNVGMPVRMMAPRVSPSATAVNREPNKVDILLYGGAAPGLPVTEIFDVSERKIVPVQGDPGPARRLHAAVFLPGMEEKVLIVGGVGEDNQPRGDSVIYDAKTRTFAPGPVVLKVPRAEFAAFTVKEDLVIVGGRGAQGALLDSAEIYDLKEVTTLPFVEMTTARPRARASATLLSNQSVVLLGGEVANGTPTNVVEVYQPRR